MARVQLEGVSKVFSGDIRAVDAVSLDVDDKEFLVLVGPSGCGKSTTLRLIAGLESLNEGEIRIGKQVVNQVAPKDRNIAMVFQNYALYPHMTVYKNMAFGLQLRYGGWLKRFWKRLTDPSGVAELKAKQQGIKQQVRRAAQMLGIEHLLDRMPRQLSGGERQRVALGRAIVREPAAFLFDEPLSNLDAKLRVEMRRELKRLHDELDATMIFVTHDQVEAMTLGQRIVVMDKGTVQQIGRPMDLYERPKNRFVASFIGTPPMNFVDGSVSETNDELWFVGTGVKTKIEADQLEVKEQNRLRQHVNRDVTLGVRPEDITIRNANAGENCATVCDVEVLGDSAVIHVEMSEADDQTHKKTLLVKTEIRTSFAPQDLVEVAFDTRRACLFDPETDENLIHTESK